jgi:hypothetical protein
VGIAVAGSDYFIGTYDSFGGGIIYSGSADDLFDLKGPSEWSPPAVAHADVVAADANYVYWADCYNTNVVIFRLPRPGGADGGTTEPQLVASDLGTCPDLLRVDGTTLWFTTPFGVGLYSIDTSQTLPAVPTVCRAGGTRGLAIGAQYVYFSTWILTEGEYNSGTGRVWRIPKDSPDCPSSSPAIYLAGDQNGPISLALDGDSLYFANEGVFDNANLVFTGGGIYRATADLSDATVVVPNLVRARVVVVSSNAVYWLTMGAEEASLGVYGVAK